MLSIKAPPVFPEDALIYISDKFWFYLLLVVKSGFNVYHAKAGKKTIGTARPGKSSGIFMLKGNEIDIGIITQANEIIENKRLNTISPVLFNHVDKPKYIKVASMQTITLIPVMLPVFNIFEKSTSVAKK